MFSRINIFFHFILLNMSFIWSQCDFNEDGQLDILDIKVVRNSWGRQINSFESKIKLLYNLWSE